MDNCLKCYNYFVTPSEIKMDESLQVYAVVSLPDKEEVDVWL